MAESAIINTYKNRVLSSRVFRYELVLKTTCKRRIMRSFVLRRNFVCFKLSEEQSLTLERLIASVCLCKAMSFMNQTLVEALCLSGVWVGHGRV